MHVSANLKEAKQNGGADLVALASQTGTHALHVWMCSPSPPKSRLFSEGSGHLVPQSCTP